MVTHRQEILKKVDQIIILKDGVIADRGMYKELKNKNNELGAMLPL
jgi:ATP-binding cassette subfamily B protein/subfamily B ATP-binding cassette protein MsbA